MRQRTNYSAVANRDAPLYFVSPLDGYYYNVSANKGAMIWKFLERSAGTRFYSTIAGLATDGILNLDEVRTAFAAEKDYLDYMLEKTTEMNLMVGVPQKKGSQTVVALRNVSEVVASVDVVGTTSTGQKLSTRVSIPANGYGQAVFNTAATVVSAEIDAEKVYPQTNYLDDIAPREIDENDPILFIKREFDRQRFADAEKNARKVLKLYPEFDDAQTFLARSLLAQSKITEAQRIYQAILASKLPTARSLAWSNVGLGEIAVRTGKASEAQRYFQQAISSGADYGATLKARTASEKLGGGSRGDASIAAFFNSFDKAVSANNKSQIDSLVLPGEVARFASSVAGQAQEWTTRLLRVDLMGEDTALVETEMSVRLLNRSNETGKAVTSFPRLPELGNLAVWKFSRLDRKIVSKLSKEVIRAARKVKFLLMDCDGVLTDGKLYFGERGEELKVFHVRDGQGLVSWHNAGFRSGIITGRKSEMLKVRAEELGIHYLIQNSKEKTKDLEKIMSVENINLEEIAYIGDDIGDLEILKMVGFPVVVADCATQVGGLGAHKTLKKGAAELFGKFRICFWIWSVKIFFCFSFLRLTKNRFALSIFNCLEQRTEFKEIRKVVTGD